MSTEIEIRIGLKTGMADPEGTNVQKAFNERYLLEGLKAIESDRILFRCNSATTPAIFSPLENSDSFIYLVMPVQIRT